ncbi:hypothetical protein [Verrucosispora sp. NA02020]|uniref:hypothetical protein n=1 Tax=Verrucosispora sp. NA02020 TaxID=2742132 RepID=UPI00159015DB|nr:hypothetical protein [Verrucosispora sp. NA02020]QKW16405.1 hypothetical protein HUT12_29090 [Verrucosispora sp. NA02020]
MPASRKPKKSRGAARVSTVTPPHVDASTDAVTPPLGLPPLVRPSAGLTSPAAPLPPVDTSRSDLADREPPGAPPAPTTGPTASGRGKGVRSDRGQRVGAGRQYAFRRK